MGTKLTQDQEREVDTLVKDSLKRATDLLRAQIAVHDRPFEAFVTMTLSIACLARAMDMPRETLLDGIGAAFDSVQEVEGPNVH